MALHKLATNAGKYGAPSKAGGTIEIIRGLDQAAGNPQFTLSRVEAGGPPVIPRSGPGSERPVLTPYLVWSWMPKSLSIYAREGLCWRLECLAERVLEIPLDFEAAGGEKAMKARVLVVEDNALVAFELCRALEAAGFEVAGPAPSVAQALTLIKERSCHAAVLDIHLRGETSEAVAHVLAALAIPFMTMTGYARTQQPPIFEGVPHFTKPVPSSMIVAELRKMAPQQ